VLAIGHLLLRGGWSGLPFPRAFWPWFLFLVLRAAFDPQDPARAAQVILAPSLVALGALALFHPSAPRLSTWKLRAILLALTLLQAVFGLLQMAGLDPLFSRAFVPGLPELLPGGFTGHHTFFGLLMAWLAFYWLTEKNWAPFLLCVAMVGLTCSVFSLASLLVGLLFFAYERGFRKSTSLLAVGLFVAGFLFLVNVEYPPGFFHHNGRLDIWVLSISAILQRPLLGYGIGAFSREFPYQQGIPGMRWEEAHNEAIEYLFNTGLVGVLFLLPFLFSVGRAFYLLPSSKHKELALGTLMIIGANAIGNFPLQLAPFASLAIFSLVWAFSARQPGSPAG
jgi:O-antigen ligase